MAEQWFVARDGKKVGPLSTEELQRRAASGQLQPADLLFKEGNRQWIAANEVSGLFKTANVSSLPPGGEANDQKAGRRRRPTIIGLLVGLVIGLCLGIGLTLWRTQASESRGSVTTANEALALAEKHLKAGESQQAYDALLVAMQVAPHEERVFDASLEFVRKAIKDNNDDDLSLAQDIYQRAANLIPFLPLARLKQAREAHTKVGEELFPGKHAPDSEDSLAEAERLLKAIEQAGLPTFAKARLLHEVDAELGNQARRVATSGMKEKEQKTFWERWGKVKKSYDDSQKIVLAALYAEDSQSRIREWLKRVADFNKSSANAALEDIRPVNEALFALVVEGQRLARDLAPYLEAGVESAVKDEKEGGLEKELVRLSLLREWNYNRWALARVDKVEQASGTALDRLRSLAAIDEARLASFVGQRFAEVWKKLFEECSKDDKVEATKLRILHEYKQ